MIRVAIADNERLTGQALARLIEAEHDMDVVGIYSDAHTMVGGLHIDADVIVLDPVGLTVTWSQFLSRVRAAQTHAQLVILTASQQRQHLFAAMRAGVHGYISKLGDAAEMPNAIRAAYRGNVTFGQAQAAQIMEEFSRPTHVTIELAPRQRELLIGIVQGKSNVEIAQELCLTEKTVRNYMRGLYAALGARSRTHAAIRAFELELVSGKDLIDRTYAELRQPALLSQVG